MAEKQEANLWRVEAYLYFPELYSLYQENYIKAKRHLAQENARFIWLRDYEPIQTEFLQLLKQGEDLFQKVQAEKERRIRSFQEQIKTLQEKLNLLTRLTRFYPGGVSLRSVIIKADIVLGEAETQLREGRLLDSQKKLKIIETYFKEIQKALYPIFVRYQDPNLISKWRMWAKETVEESKEKGFYSILIIKSERKLILYHKGEIVKTFPIGLGENGLLNKRYAKDNATPEGKYYIIGKNPKTKFYRALLINYPNENDRKEFEKAKQKGLLVKKATIGGGIEIHGGGKDNLTYGCIALDNGSMKELYQRVEIGTPVTIVGALDEKNSLSLALRELEIGHGKKETP
ncbi:MAG: L,D-transpeptidase family protein [Thermodesulfobacteriota bacterium]